MHMMIATPTYDGTIDRETYHSVIALVAAMMGNRRGKVSVQTKSNMLVDRARNLFASRVLNDPDCTHLLFVDADMGFAPDAIFRLLDFDKPVTAIVYPSKVLPLRFVAEESLERKNGALVLHEGRFVRTKQIGTGLMLIKREVFEILRDAYPELYLRRGTPYSRAAGLGGPLLQAFAPLYEPTGRILSEDISFCRRWTATGGEIWASTGEEVSHVGRHVVRAAYPASSDAPIGAAAEIAANEASEPDN